MARGQRRSGLTEPDVWRVPAIVAPGGRGHDAQRRRGRQQGDEDGGRGCGDSGVAAHLTCCLSVGEIAVQGGLATTDMCSGGTSNFD